MNTLALVNQLLPVTGKMVAYFVLIMVLIVSLVTMFLPIFNSMSIISLLALNSLRLVEVNRVSRSALLVSPVEKAKRALSRL
jgi:TRAP-type mannitol/chloroaromatic compound transport system permease small subunit